jgi:hypothetical protein
MSAPRPAYALVASLLLVACSVGDSKEVNLGGTRLCFPRHYSPDFSLTIWLMSRGAPDSDDEALIYVPATEVKESIPAYSLSHANQYTSAVPHDITGIAYGRASQKQRVDLASSAWRIAAAGHKYFVVPDKESGFWRIYEHHNPSFMWHMVASPPPDSPNGSNPPQDWYIGHCLQNPGGYACDQSVKNDSVLYEYELDKRDLHLRSSVASLLTGKLKEWGDACEG